MQTILTSDYGMPRIGAHSAELALGVPKAAWLPVIEATSRGRQFIDPIETVDHPTCVAWVDAGRWLAACPYCGAAQWVTWRDPRLWCVMCENTRAAGRWMHVVFPADDLREEAERVLAARMPRDRFWFPDRETPLDLMGENVSMLNVPPFEGW